MQALNDFGEDACGHIAKCESCFYHHTCPIFVAKINQQKQNKVDSFEELFKTNEIV